MQEVLIRKLHDYTRDNHPDLFILLNAEGRLTDFLIERAASIDVLLDSLLRSETAPYTIEDICMMALTADLKPSRFNYIMNLLQEEFETTCEQWKGAHILLYEVINLITLCKPVFDAIGFTEEDTENTLLRAAITELIGKSLERKSENENSESWDTMYSKN